MSHHHRLVIPSASYESKFLPPREAANDEAAGKRCQGRLFLVGDDDVAADPAKGIALLQDAAQSGDAEACNLLATLAAAGAWTPQSWPRSLDLLQKAAEFGSDDAREQLVLLAQDSAEAPDWGALRR